MIMKDNSNYLTNYSMRVLSMYHDGECGLFTRSIARFLLASNKNAISYLDSLSEQGTLIKSWSREEEQRTINWDHLSQRISQEEYSQVFLGDRKGSVEKSNSWFKPLGWGLSGAFASAMLVFSVMVGGVSDPQSKIDYSKVSDKSLYGIPVVSQVNSPSVPTSRRVSVQSNSPIELEWLRSEGNLRMITPVRQGEVPIIWIKPKSRKVKSQNELANPANSQTRVPQAIVVNNAK